MLILGFIIGAACVMKYNQYKLSKVSNIGYITKLELQLKQQRQLMDELDIIVFDMKQSRFQHIESKKKVAAGK